MDNGSPVVFAVKCGQDKKTKELIGRSKRYGGKIERKVLSLEIVFSWIGGRESARFKTIDRLFESEEKKIYSFDFPCSAVSQILS